MITSNILPGINKTTFSIHDNIEIAIPIPAYAYRNNSRALAIEFNNAGKIIDIVPFNYRQNTGQVW